MAGRLPLGDLDPGAGATITVRVQQFDPMAGVNVAAVGFGSPEDVLRNNAAAARYSGFAPNVPTGMLVTVAGPPEARPADGLAVDLVVVSDRAQLGEIARRVRDGRLRTNIGRVATLDDAVAAFNPTEPIKGNAIIRVRP